ncbi:hypothetical protein B0J13DRAFT_617297 [Dactylonectria estremocensis]|uniref:Uncharacterized protein n=1 Tax=Dactylonectria estremocensis TaxID=1079267 RepID=A0A9P9FEP2_9HYPO|nr:hypothetical protein B0J13DRAFT_617297 [Dactylonectria estremocensis]
MAYIECDKVSSCGKEIAPNKYKEWPRYPHLLCILLSIAQSRFIITVQQVLYPLIEVLAALDLEFALEAVDAVIDLCLECPLGHAVLRPPAVPKSVLLRFTTRTRQPPHDSTLKHIILGISMQTYTCAAIARDLAAMLYDVTDLYPRQSHQSLTHNAFNALTSTTLRTHNVPLNFNDSSVGRVEPFSLRASLTGSFSPFAKVT